MLKSIKTITIGFLILSPIRTQNLETMFEEVIWEEQTQVTVKEYKIDKITHVAGVRGAEAEDEILSYLYYRLNSKTNQIPPKLLQLLLSDTNTY